MKIITILEFNRILASEKYRHLPTLTEKIARISVDFDLSPRSIVEMGVIKRKTLFAARRAIRMGYTPGKRGRWSRLRDAQTSRLIQEIEEKSKSKTPMNARQITAKAFLHFLSLFISFLFFIGSDTCPKEPQSQTGSEAAEQELWKRFD